MAHKRSTQKDLIVSSGAAPARSKSPRSRRAQPAGTSVAAPQEVSAAAVPVPYEPSHEEIATLAYLYWEARGCQGGSPDEDWTRAENELRSRNASAATA